MELFVGVVFADDVETGPVCSTPYRALALSSNLPQTTVRPWRLTLKISSQFLIVVAIPISFQCWTTDTFT